MNIVEVLCVVTVKYYYLKSETEPKQNRDHFESLMILDHEDFKNDSSDIPVTVVWAPGPNNW